MLFFRRKEIPIIIDTDNIIEGKNSKVFQIIFNHSPVYSSYKVSFPKKYPKANYNLSIKTGNTLQRVEFTNFFQFNFSSFMTNYKKFSNLSCAGFVNYMSNGSRAFDNSVAHWKLTEFRSENTLQVGSFILLHNFVNSRLKAVHTAMYISNLRTRLGTGIYLSKNGDEWLVATTLNQMFKAYPNATDVCQLDTKKY